MPHWRIFRNADAAARVTEQEVVALTEQATRATFYVDGLSPDQVAANERIPPLSGPTFFEAARSYHQHLAAGFIDDRLAGFMIATRHTAESLELDWLMVHPRAHGQGLAASLVEEGLAWLGPENPIWLTVIRHNHRAIAFYRKFGFEIDEAADRPRPVPSCIMRRPPDRERSSGL